MSPLVVCPNPDNLDAYTPGQTGPYNPIDQTSIDQLWHVVTLGCTGCPTPIHGFRSLWMGKCDPTWAIQVGYPNNTYQILYVDTGAHGADYDLQFSYNVSSEYGYDFLYLIGGGNSGADPVSFPVK